MTIKKSDTKKHISKNIAKVLTATMAAATIVAVLPADFTRADIPQGGSVTDSAYNENPSNNVTDAVYTEVDPEAKVTVVAQSTEQALEKVLNAESAGSLQIAITAVELALNLTSYNALTSEDQTAVAQALLSDPSKVEYTDTEALQVALNKAVAAQRDAAALRNAVAAVNSSSNATQMKSALEAPYLGLVLMNYRKLSPDGKLEVAETLRNTVPAGGFLSRADIQKAFNGVVAPIFQSEAK